MTQRSRMVGVALSLLVLSALLSACGAAPVAQNWPGLTSAGDTLYVISGVPQKVFLLDAETGMQKGTPFVPGGIENGIFYWSPVTIAADVAFVGFADSQSGAAGLYAFDPTTGQELWHVPADNLILPAPAYADGVVYFGDSDGRLVAVDVESKSLKPGFSFEAGEAIWASPLVREGRLYVASMDHHLYALDAETGQELWRTDVGGAMAAPPILDEEGAVLYVGAFDGRVHALHADSGEPVAGFDFRAGNWIWSELLLDDGHLYATSLDGRLYDLDPATGAVFPPYPYNSGSLDNTKTAIRTAPVKVDEAIVVATETGRVVAVRNGQPLWSWPSGVPQGAIYTTPVVDNGRLYVVLMNGLVQSLDANNGVPGWSFAPPEGN